MSFRVYDEQPPPRFGGGHQDARWGVGHDEGNFRKYRSNPARSAEYIRARKNRFFISWQVAGACASAEEAKFTLGNWIASDAIKRWRAEH
jgi:hypothetical protein